MELPWTPQVGYRKLRVWHAGIALIKDVYAATANFPAVERFGITANIRRAGVSIPVNIAEGSGRRTTGELLNFVSIAAGSAEEVATFIVVSYELGYLPEAEAVALFNKTEVISRMLNGMRKKLEARLKSR